MNRPNLYEDCNEYKVHIYKSHEDWLANRGKGIGGSSASSLINMNPYRDNNELWKEHKGIVIPKDISDKPYVKYGNDAEPLLRMLFELDYPKYDVQYIENTTLQSKKNDFMTYSPDALLIERDTGRRGVWECKTTNILQSRQKENWNEQIPQNYFIQVLWGLLVTGFDFVVLKAQLKSEWDGEVRLTTKHYYFSREDVQDQLDWLEEEAIERWNKYYIGDVEPPIELNF